MKYSYDIIEYCLDKCSEVVDKSGYNNYFCLIYDICCNFKNQETITFCEKLLDQYSINLGYKMKDRDIIDALGLGISECKKFNKGIVLNCDKLFDKILANPTYVKSYKSLYTLITYGHDNVCLKYIQNEQNKELLKLDYINKYGRTILMHALYYNNEKTADELLNYNCIKFDQVDVFDETALIIAMIRQYFGIAYKLIKRVIHILNILASVKLTH